MKKEKKETSKYSKASFILSLFFWVPLLNNFTAALAIAFGYVALKEYNPKTQKGRWMAISGVTIAIITILLSIVGLITFYVRPDLFAAA